MTAQIDLEDRVPAFCCRAFEPSAASADTDIKDKSVEPTELGDRFADHARNVIFLSHVSDDGDGFTFLSCDYGTGRFGTRRIAVSDGHRGALAREEDGDGPSISDRGAFLA